jgi:integrase
VAFFSFFRKSNLLPSNLVSYDPSRHLSRHNITFSQQGAIINVQWSKTIQYQDRVLSIPLAFTPSSSLCPSSALWLAMSQSLSSHQSPFHYSLHGSPNILVYPVFLQFLKQCLDALGFPSSRYSGHSFRRGGATFALESGVPADYVQTQGDWRSDAYKVYIDPSLTARMQVAGAMARAIQTYV